MEFGITGLRGTTRWLETQSTPLRDGQRNIIAALNVTRDVTNRKKTETDLARAAERLSEAKTIAQLGSFSSDLLGGKIAFSPEVYRILGSAPGLLLEDRRLPGADEGTAGEMGEMLYGDGEQVRTAYQELIAGGKELDLTFLCAGRITKCVISTSRARASRMPRESPGGFSALYRTSPCTGRWWSGCGN